MRIECAVLCDAASVRDELLNLIGAGVSRVTFPDLPGALPITLAVRVVLETRELRDRYVLTLNLKTIPEEKTVQGAEVAFEVQKRDGQREEEAALAFAIPLGIFEITKPGRYLLEATFGDRRLGTFPLRVESLQSQRASEGPGGEPNA